MATGIKTLGQVNAALAGLGVFSTVAERVRYEAPINAELVAAAERIERTGQIWETLSSLSVHAKGRVCDRTGTRRVDWMFRQTVQQAAATLRAVQYPAR